MTRGGHDERGFHGGAEESDCCSRNRAAEASGHVSTGPCSARRSAEEPKGTRKGDVRLPQESRTGPQVLPGAADGSERGSGAHGREAQVRRDHTCSEPNGPSSIESG